jgi:hypothetical protein
LLGCGLFGGDDDFDGDVAVGLTDTIGANGAFTIRNVFAPNVREVLAIVQIENAKSGTEIKGEWLQLATLQPRAANQTPEGIKVSEAGFKLEQSAINAESGRGGGTLRLVPNAPLPEDTYLLRVYVNGELAKTVGFVVSRQAALLDQPGAQPPAAPPGPPPAPPPPPPPAGASPTPTRTP